MKYLDEEPNHFHREDYYMAQIASEIRKGNVKHPSHVKTKNFLIPFKMATKASLTNADRLGQSKAYWLGRCGIEES
jgi:hypothetical protein